MMLSYFANEEAGALKGWAPELGVELARCLGTPYEFVHIENPAHMIDAFHDNRVDVAFIGVGYTKGQSAAVVEFCRKFEEDIKASGLPQKALDRMGSKSEGVVVLTQ
ncbi:MAG TPA: hypothetical protein VEW70_16540 [Burkholderiales bacterium]|nr:hypothetical protein [Burkholderiales bacterium]